MIRRNVWVNPYAFGVPGVTLARGNNFIEKLLWTSAQDRVRNVHHYTRKNQSLIFNPQRSLKRINNKNKNKDKNKNKNEKLCLILSSNI